MKGSGNTQRTGKNSYSHAFDFDEPGAGIVNTPGPRPATTEDQKLVLALASSLRRHPEDVNANLIASGLLTQDPRVQENLSQIAFALLGYWSEMADCTSPTHPLRHVYDTAKKMVNSLFD